MDVFGLGSSPLTGIPTPVNQQGSPLLAHKAGTGLQPNMGMGLQPPMMGMGQQQPVMGMGLHQMTPAVAVDPLAVLDNVFVSLDSIQPGTTRTCHLV